MPIIRGQVAKRVDVLDAIREHNSFGEYSMESIEIVLPSPKPHHREYLGRNDRAYIKDAATGKILVTAPSAYALVQKIHDGWKYQPYKKEGLWQV